MQCSCASGTYIRGARCDPCPPGHYCRFHTKHLCAAGRWGDGGYVRPIHDRGAIPGSVASGTPNKRTIGNGATATAATKPLAVPEAVARADGGDSGGYLHDSAERDHTSLCSGACAPGHFCPPGSRDRHEHRCPSGTYNPRTGASDVGDCLECQRGHYCPEASTSPYELPCPAGTYGDALGLKNSQCSGACPAGHYCPERTTRPLPCPAGMYIYVCITDTYLKEM